MLRSLALLGCLVLVAGGGSGHALATTSSFTFVELQSNGPGSDDSEVLWVVNQDGTDLRRLTPPFPCIDCAESPRFSPDGRTIAFSGFDFQQQSDIESIGVDGSDLRPAACYRCSDVPAWSPNGKRIAAGAIGGKVVISDYPSGRHGRIVPNIKSASGLDWSRDGSRLAYTDDNGRLHVISIDGRDGEQLAQDASSPRFSPDGRTILFARAQDRGIYLISRGGGRARRIAVGGSAAWASDGRRIAIMGGGGPTITIVTLESGETQRLRLPKGVCTGSKYCVDLDWRS